jgi:holdfast attachment protein HfaA
MRCSILHITTAACGFSLLATACFAGDYSTDSSYNTPYGMTAGAENQPVNASLRDANGNLTVVNGQFTSSAMSQQSGVQNMSAMGSSSVSSGVGTGTSASGGLFGQATAVGNSLNVVTVGNDNTVVVTAQQTNNGNQTATVSVNGH